MSKSRLIAAVLALGAAISGSALGADSRGLVSFISVETRTAENDHQLARAAAWARRELARAPRPEVVLAQLSADQSLEGIARQIAGETAELTRVELPDDELLAKRAVFRDWFSRHYRVTFTVVSGLLNTGVVTSSLIVSSDIPPTVAATLGLVAGGLSAGFQYYNEQFQAWMLKSRGAAGKFAKWYGAEVACLGVAKLCAIGAGAHGEPGVWLPISSVLKAALFSTLALGPWDVAIAEEGRSQGLARPERLAVIRLWSDFKVLLVSAASLGSVIPELLGVNLSEVPLIGLGVTGAVHYVYQRSKAAKTRACEALLRGEDLALATR